MNLIKINLKFKIIIFLLMGMMCLSFYGMKYGFKLKQVISVEKITNDEGNAFITEIMPSNSWLFYIKSDGEETQNWSNTILLEQNTSIGTPHSSHNEIRLKGGGTYSHWNNTLWFSASDNSDPRYNGKIYEVIIPYYLNPSCAWIVIISGIVISVLLVLFLLKPTRKQLFSILALLMFNYLIISFISRSYGIWFWLGLSFISLNVLYLIQTFVILSGNKRSTTITNSMLVLCSVSFCTICLEGYLQLEQKLSTSVPYSSASFVSKKAINENAERKLSIPIPDEVAINIKNREKYDLLPDEWKKKIIQIPGAKNAFLWHAVVHVFDDNNFRRSTSFTPKKSDTFRVLIAGDSLTYGYGVEKDFIYANLLQTILGRNYKIEILSLGQCGAQSEDVLNIVRKFLPILDPDLVIYGMCHNDFLPSGVGALERIKWGFLPKEFPLFLCEHSSLGQFLDGYYKKALLELGISKDFFDDILENFSDYQKRFAKDVQEMNNFVVSHGKPPIIAMVLDQTPLYGNRGYRITKIAEDSMKAAGMRIIETEEYYRQFNGKNMAVSRWEGHPNEEAHAIFASMIYDNLKELPELKKYKKNIKSEDAWLSKND